MYYYKLNQNILLRGWLDVPYAICNKQTGQTFSISKDQLDLLKLCDGKTKIDNKNIEILERKKVIEKCESNDFIFEEQKFRFYNCRYVKKVDWSITGKCNYRCKHCFVSAPNNKFGELSLETCLNFINQFEKCGIRNVLITGGEPLVRKDFMKIIDRLISKNICIETISTNGALLTESFLSELKSKNLKTTFGLSFDGVGCHDFLRGVKGAEKSAVRAIKLLNKYNFPVIVRMVVHSGNFNSIKKTIDFLSQFNIKEFKIGDIMPAGDWLNQKQSDLKITQLYDVYLNVITHFIKNNSPINLHIAGFFCCAKNSKNYVIPNAKFDGSESAKDQFLCKHTKNMLYLAGDGQLFPCMAVSGISDMNINKNNNKKLSLIDTDLYDILSSEEQTKDVGKCLSYLLDVNEKCRKCDYKFICGGGCRANAAAYSGNYYGCDEHMCTFYKNNYKEKIANVVQETHS